MKASQIKAIKTWGKKDEIKGKNEKKKRIK